MSGPTAMDADRVPSHLAYRAVRRHVAKLVLRSPDVAGTAVPACPEWTVRDVVAHLAGNCAGMLGAPATGNGAGLAGLLAWWQQTGERVEALAASGELHLDRMLMDAFTHELDLRSALCVAPPAEHPAYPAAFDVVVGGLYWSISMHDLPALRLTCESASWVVGRGRPVATLTAPRYHLYRSLTGRRTPAQIAGLDWTADPGRWLPAFYWGPFAAPLRPAEQGSLR
jgi:uncharacterized protein (TIGR03083 family)